MRFVTTAFPVVSGGSVVLWRGCRSHACRTTAGYGSGSCRGRASRSSRGVYVLRRVEGDQVHFLLLTFWDSIEAIKRFAGEDAERARYYPADEEYLLEKEARATHYEVLA